ncbi:hypothetical protein Zm00014a_039182 [Zea mays]|uniref:Uncharacterized protein n=2 Tax=Zea mays TaxID=4577 RepID=A0A3L6F718_MAIZE|nr:hypothetical protein Zm00014a_028402 [Zea mays]PWZ28956.1 hypothetical protein Zm00014a_039182 [Zea mays]
MHIKTFGQKEKILQLAQK